MKPRAQASSSDASGELRHSLVFRAAHKKRAWGLRDLREVAVIVSGSRVLKACAGTKCQDDGRFSSQGSVVLGFGSAVIVAVMAASRLTKTACH